MDKLYIKDLEVFANHGVFEEEKRLGQKFVISVTLELDMHAAAVTGLSVSARTVFIFTSMVFKASIQLLF